MQHHVGPDYQTVETYLQESSCVHYQGSTLAVFCLPLFLEPRDDLLHLGRIHSSSVVCLGREWQLGVFE